MRVLILEDDIIIARYIELQVKNNFPCTTAIALNNAELQLTMSEMLPHLVLCDINLEEDQDGIRLIEELRRHYCFEVIFITSYQSKAIIEDALKQKPLNYIIKPVDESAIYAALKLAWPTLEANKEIGAFRKKDLPVAELTSMERRIMHHISQNRTTREIADLLYLSPYTVKNHRHSICQKLDLKDGNNALLRWVMQNKELIPAID
ncbi:MAG TPA: response regulator [Flavihumibacter sp.]|jgi:DNA-binding NarL/FixJ family response regulator